ncbi:MAG TPA: hypothetical protein VFV68_07590, partial [Agriterribacter sp.]|nr:hypothetical protein [Agriterribacter sp.]
SLYDWGPGLGFEDGALALGLVTGFATGFLPWAVMVAAEKNIEMATKRSFLHMNVLFDLEG